MRGVALRVLDTVMPPSSIELQREPKVLQRMLLGWPHAFVHAWIQAHAVGSKESRQQRLVTRACHGHMHLGGRNSLRHAHLDQRSASTAQEDAVPLVTPVV